MSLYVQYLYNQVISIEVWLCTKCTVHGAQRGNLGAQGGHLRLKYKARGRSIKAAERLLGAKGGYFWSQGGQSGA